MGNIIPGTTFVNGQLVTASDLNNQLENATINSDVITPGMLNSTLITGNSELEELDVKDEDFFLVWSSVNNAFRKVRKGFIGSGSGSSGGSAFTLSGTTLTMTSGGTGTATFSLSGSTLTITT
jgi:hypothetical protein